MFGFSVPELILILIIGIIIFGPNRLPDIGRFLGKGLNELRKVSAEKEKFKEPFTITEKRERISGIKFLRFIYIN